MTGPTGPYTMTARITRGMVAAPNPTAAQAGLEMLQAGGNAFDAAVAAAFALCVVTPASTGIAGYGGCLVAHVAARRALVAVDFTSVAPAAARADMYPVQEDGAGGFTVPDGVNAFGALAVDVPGIVAGLTHTLSRFGTLPLRTVLQPAITAAVDGYPIDAWTVLKTQEMIVPNAQRFPDTFRLFTIDGRLPQPGETMVNPDLGPVLERIGRDGPEAFYRGEIASAIIDTVRHGGGMLTLDDLAGYRVDEHAPVTCDYHPGHRHGDRPGSGPRTVATPHLPTGGLTILQMLRVLEGFAPSEARADADLAHLLIETSKVCWRERLTKYGDRRVVPVDVGPELGEPLVHALRNEVTEGLKAPGPGRIIAPDPLLVGTVHLCAADREGNVVSLTQTHGGSYGSLLTVPGTGILLSHGMSRFDPRPERANSIAPGKRPLHNMCPMLVLQDGRPHLAIGGAGGRTIVSNLVHVLVRVMDQGDTLERAITAPRFHVETAEPVMVERGSGALADGLARLGHAVTTRPKFGSLQGIEVDGASDSMTGVADPRRAGTILWV